MEKIGFIFPGQGSQYIGMGHDLYEKYQAARDIFDAANDALGFDLKKICFQGPKEELTRTDISQPAIVTTSIAALKALQEEVNFNIQPVVAAGLSLGEYSALIAAGVINFEDAVKLVYKRGEFMQEAADENKGAMASVLGLSEEAVEKVSEKAGVSIANLNSPGQIVISGLTDNINKAAELARAEGATRVVILDVSGPFHSKYMLNAGARLQKELETAMFFNPKFRIIANVTADYQDNAEQIKKNLIAQVSGSVLWEPSVRLMAAEGITTLLEIGPGSVLKGLIRRIDSNIKVYNIGKVKEIEEMASLAATLQ
ncbi:MAG: [acyl-carrier-protein] S-malonyltransferase [Candidatus Omnitrophica bacterium CG12_big_fil_rev_8_21_14_0_65_43_15]|uniref:Malonyl CoA-acyl carrier protein transacylase n=1 Tax=Candidatus Taenaricola geysiri TaxID=1974752 RepID=A0A2J0LMR0_9BACT|nr:MAG: [acyl-carrier-protein] S-malonyltransferase [Candidatus Omnitrophica bacterium CG1_02_43_210]PIR65594.1 MAG: [acyl-carrier-protein] S-malonyltransferase [Candidatus Omnitrophica bacterium CG10_big_fil_rev_8_21_14_0_10_43_8]PIV11797.1 MAG: [acyl-carrier-protein] S-malonyltransferase [Candidatus Omnitrophica bacterium CG03_land_8_20_14_0_80_43_22]PIW66863.1 MAG: [acyl-carrier-protein] S-malonyltransferase [Candidatus Omnitrophica bacterium CG12_big_fil_rev_8_21_14_0_65_43_15]PIW80490.1 MA